MDPLAAIISLLRPRTVLSKVVSGAGAWSIRKPAYDEPAFCIMLEGSCFLVPDGLDALELEHGDFVFLPQMPAFTLASDRNLPPTSIGLDSSRETRHGALAGPPAMRMLGGYFRFDRANATLLRRLLPPLVHIRRDESGASRLRRIVELISEETETDGPGRDLILERLVQVVLVEALRFRSRSPARQERGLLAGLSDPALARALREIQGDLARKWTVAALARTAFLSRAVFAERFARMVGMPPMEYLLEWRMAVAKDMLRHEHQALAEVAGKVGYQSASAFSTAFTRLTGRSPRGYARASEEGVPVV